MHEFSREKYHALASMPCERTSVQSYHGSQPNGRGKGIRYRSSAAGEMKALFPNVGGNALLHLHGGEGWISARGEERGTFLLCRDLVHYGKTGIVYWGRGRGQSSLWGERNFQEEDAKKSNNSGGLSAFGRTSCGDPMKRGGRGE